MNRKFIKIICFMSIFFIVNWGPGITRICNASDQVNVKNPDLVKLHAWAIEASKDNPAKFLANEFFKIKVKRLPHFSNNKNELKKFVGQIKKELDFLVKEYKENRREKRKINTNFFGNPENAQNASENDKSMYSSIKNHSKKLFEEEKLTPKTYELVTTFLTSMETLYTFNSVICKDLQEKGESILYQKEIWPDLHFKEKQIPFELIAPISTQSLFKAYTYVQEKVLSEKNEVILQDFFHNALASETGCLNARIRTIDKWLHKQKVEEQNENRENVQMDKGKIHSFVDKYLQFQIPSSRLEQILEKNNGLDELVQEITTSYGSDDAKKIIQERIKELYF